MTQKDKELLLTVLCTMLRYGVKVTTTNPAVEFGIISGISIKDKISVSTKDADIVFECTEVTPYLRSMSSMTEEERKEYEDLIIHKEHINAQGQEWDIDCFSFEGASRLINWLNAHHFDYRGLIPKGLAIEAPEGMYNI